MPTKVSPVSPSTYGFALEQYTGIYYDLSGFVTVASDKSAVARLLCQAIITENCDSDRGVLQATMAPASVACPDITTSGSAASAPSLPALDSPAGFAVPIPIVLRSANCSLSALAC